MKLPRLAIDNAQFTLTIMLLMVLVGVVSYLNMPRSEDPQFDLPVTLIEVVYPGASPSDIETLVVDPLEQEITDIENIKKIEAKIHNGAVRITIDFLYGTDAEAAFNKVKQAVSTVRPNLPAGIAQLLVLKATPSSVAIMQLALWSEPTDYKTMELHAKLLEKRLETIASVRKASIWGYPRQIVAVDINLVLIKHYGLALTDITQILQGRAKNITPGFVDANTRRFNVKASGNFTQLVDIENTIISNSSMISAYGLLKIKDVASVSFSDAEPSYLAYFDDIPAIFITVEQREKTNIFVLTEQINQELEHFKQNLPSNLKIDKLFQQADSVNIRVNGFFDNLTQGLIIVGLMALLFLGIREALVVIIAIPISFMMAIGWLDFSGYGLQQMSIVGLIIALGLLVDNAIVVTESIHREKKLGKDIKTAAANGTSKVAWAIASGTITTMLAFLPMLMIQSNTGDFIRSMPVTVVLVLFASLLVALTLTPLLASKLLVAIEQDTKPKVFKVNTLQHYLNIFAEKSYANTLTVLMRNKVIVIIISLLLLVAMFSLFAQVGVSLFPKAEKPMILINVSTPANSSLAHTDKVLQQVRQHVKKYTLVDKVALNIGNANPRIYYNEVPKRGMIRFGQALLVLKAYQADDVTKLVKNLRDDFNQWQQAEITIKEFTQGPVTDQVIAIRLLSESLIDLEKVANHLAAQMRQISGVVNIDNPIGMANAELALSINYQQAALSGVSIERLDNTISTILSGTTIGQFNDINGEDYPILVRRNNPNIDSLSAIEVSNNQGVAIPLEQLATMELKKGGSDFFHYQKLRMAKVSADVETGYSVGEITHELVNYLERYDLPKGMYFTLGGEEESRQKTFAGLTQVMLITAMGIFAVLVLQFKSILQPMIIFSSIPFAMAGSVIGLYLTGLSFSMMAFVGLISLFGIVVNNAIILIDSTNVNLKLGLDRRSAILKSSAERFTPILLTTLTTIGGLIPLTLFGGGLWQPLGVVLISGLCVSALSSFLLVPILTELFTPKTNVENSN
ncbi:efflux RND transporter permease subunit [Colwellia psychrerythraea]|uniref:Acriflavin resistance protein n=1 Tax=Colwellia psychrerythraea TaxID=28229 RepID=A0A099L1P2_COLPS|nr:efflux RND transporter permease subunit [Colwellia psychrerythraea]KGJ96761.1 acriflavin resistance protein [Colwellia psychrerythraea]